MKNNKISRRQALKLSGGTVAATGLGLYAPAVISSDPITLRYLGTAVSMGDEVQKKLFEDTGLKVKFIATKRVRLQQSKMMVHLYFQKNLLCVVLKN